MATYPQIEHIVRRLRRTLRARGYRAKTQEAYLRAICRFLMFHRDVHPMSLGEGHFNRYLSFLTEERRLAPASRNQAASAISLFFREVQRSDIGDRIPRARGRDVMPVVFSHREAMAVIDQLSGKYRTIARLLYGSGLRISECMALRIKDLDFDLSQISARNAKGGRDRFTILPGPLTSELRQRIDQTQQLHESDLAKGKGWAALPGALARKDPRAGYRLGWQFLFPSSRISKDPATGRPGRWHLDVSAPQRQIKRAIGATGITKPATTHTFRHSFATETLRAGYDLRTLQQLMGHGDIRVTMRYVHAVQQTGIAIRSPLEQP